MFKLLSFTTLTFKWGTQSLTHHSKPLDLASDKYVMHMTFRDRSDHLGSFLTSQAKEVANINGEKIDNASEEEESEEVESEEEEGQQASEEPVGAAQEATSEFISQVGTGHISIRPNRM